MPHARFRGRRRDRIVEACPTGKRAYPKRQVAVQAAHAARKVQPQPLYVYRHDELGGCGQYHLTTQNPLWHYRPTRTMKEEGTR